METEKYGNSPTREIQDLLCSHEVLLSLTLTLIMEAVSLGNYLAFPLVKI